VAVFWSNLNIVVTPVDVECREERFALELFKNVGDLGYGIDVSDRPLVDFAVVLHWS
jgi:hypothetical protein